MNVELGLLYKSPKSEFKNDGAFPLVESTIDYIDAIVQAIVVNKQKLAEKDFRTQFFNNRFTELANAKDLSLWNEFQQVSQNSAVFSLENILAEIDFEEGGFSEKDLFNRLEDPISKLAIEVVKQTATVQMLCSYDYDPRVALSERIYTRKVVKLIEKFDSWEEDVREQHKIYIKESKEIPIYDLYREKEALKEKIVLFDAQSTCSHQLPWQKQETVENNQTIYRIKEPTFNEKTRKLLCTTNPRLAVEGAEKISDYTKVLVQFIKENEQALTNPLFRQDFFENFSLYISFKEKNLSLEKEFQQVSRAFKEFHFEHIFQKIDFSQGTLEPATLTKLLNHEMKRLAVEVAKKDPNVALFYRYDQQLFKHLAFEVFSDDQHDYSSEDLVEFLDGWKDLVREEEEGFSADRETKLHDLYHSRHEIEKQVFFLDNKNQFVRAPWEREFDWEECSKRSLTEASLAKVDYQVSSYSEEKLKQLADYITRKKNYLVDRISEQRDEVEKSSLVQTMNELQELQEKLVNERVLRNKKELDKVLAKLDTYSHTELQSNILLMKEKLNAESANPYTKEVMIEQLKTALEKLQVEAIFCQNIEQLIRNSRDYSLRHTCELITYVEEKTTKLASQSLTEGDLIIDRVNYWQKMQEQMKIVIRVKEEIEPIKKLVNQAMPKKNTLQNAALKVGEGISKIANQVPEADKFLVYNEWNKIESAIRTIMEHYTGIDLNKKVKQLLRDSRGYELNDVYRFFIQVRDKVSRLAKQPSNEGTSITDQVSYWQGMQEQVEIILRVKEEIAPISCLISQDSPDERELQNALLKIKEAIKRMNRLPAAYRPLVDKEWQTIEISVNQAISWAHYKKNAQKKQSLFTRLRKLICRKSPHSAQLDNHSLPVDQSASSTIHKEDFSKEPSLFSRLQKLTRGENSRSPQTNKQRSGEKGERC